MLKPDEVNRFINGDWKVAVDLNDWDYCRPNAYMGFACCMGPICEDWDCVVDGNDGPYPVGYVMRAARTKANGTLIVIGINGIGPLRPCNQYNVQPWWPSIGRDANHVVISEGITRIEGRAFSRMPHLFTVSIPSTCEYIDPEALYSSPLIRRIDYNGTVKQWDKVCPPDIKLFPDRNPYVWPAVLCTDGVTFH